MIKTGWPAWLVALSINGFFVYLAVLDAIDTAPMTKITAVYYAALGALMTIAAWGYRNRLRERLSSGGRLATIATVSAGILAIWFLLNVALLSEGSLGPRLAALLVLSTLPTALLVAALPKQLLERAGYAIVSLGIAFLAIEAFDLAHAHDEFFRFSPIAALDPISAAKIPAVAAVVAVVLRPPGLAARVFLLACFTLFTASAVIPGARGPLVALVIAVLALVVVAGTRPRDRLVVLACLFAGLGIGLAAASQVGSYGYLQSSLPGFGGDGGGATNGDATNDGATNDGTVGGPAISTISIRRQWLEQAVSDIPDRPLFGHGVGMLVDDTPEAKRMGVAGQRIYPHNSLVEAAYSLGLIGLLSYLVFFGAAIWAAVRLRHRRRSTAALLMIGLGVYGLVDANISGEIGADLLVWTAAALAISLYAEQRRTIPVP